ncbi:protein Mis18-alpha-like [Chamaea fasciata]|uniref:protein Mis18-alpha-like n=1 Tax=Chamaea fasciata TaxID=190680 RepID=UPI003369C91A
MSGAAAGPPAGGRDTLALCPEREHSLSLLEPGGGRPDQQQQQQQRERRADAAPVPVAFVCAGCGRPGGGTRGWVFSDDESGCILLRAW